MILFTPFKDGQEFDQSVYVWNVSYRFSFSAEIRHGVLEWLKQ